MKWQPVVIWVAIFTIVLVKAGVAQEKPSMINTMPPDTNITDSISVADTTIALSDTTATDTTSKPPLTGKYALEERLGIRISPDAMDDIVESEASDSAVINMKENNFYLYGNAKVAYQDMDLKAGKIVYDQSKNLVTATPLLDTFTKLKNRPSFTQGNETFTYDSLKYNFKSKRAIVLNPRTQYGEGYVYSKQVKRNPDQTIYGLHNVYTTCALDTPHFGINAKKIKVIPNKVVASGPANIAIENVPTPLFLPFGLFPISKGQRSGFLLPTYTIEEARGVGLLDGGYYFYLGDKVDLETRTRIYSRGSWQVSSRSSYVNRYKYFGALAVTYAYNKTGEDYEIGASTTRDFNVQWQHSSDPKSRPNSNFSASVNAGTSSFNANTSYDVERILNNQYNSNITYTKDWANKPYNLSVGARHSQEARTGQVNVSFPEVSFFARQLNRFISSDLGTKWYDKINIDYQFQAQNQLTFTDTLFSINRLNIGDFENAMKHTIPLTATYNVFRFVNLSLNAGYNEYWYTKQSFRAYNYITDDIDTTINRGFYAARDYNASINASTTIYGLKMFKKGKLMGIRHRLEPNVSLNYVPDFAKPPYNYGYQTIIDPRGEPRYISQYEGSLLGAPSQLGNYRSVVGFDIRNNLQIKVRQKAKGADTAGSKNVSIIDNFSISTGYDLAVDSFNWQDLRLIFSTTFLNILNVTANASFDQYAFDYETGRRKTITMLQQGTGIARFTTAGVSLSGNLHAKKKEDGSPVRESDEFRRLMQYGYAYDYVDFNIPWNMTFNYTLQLSKNYVQESRKDSLVFSAHNVMVGGDMNLTERWKIGIRTSYSLIENKLQATQLDLYRDLHCWQMRLSAVPFGANRNYNFTINAKASILQDLKLLRRRDFRDAVY